MPKTKVVLIGASGYTADTVTHQLVSFGWNQLVNLPNLQDFDIVVINLLENVPAAGDVTIWTPFFAHVTEYTAKQILEHNGSVYVLGDPRLTVLRLTDDKKDQTKHAFLDWTGAKFHWNVAGGTFIEITTGNTQLREYLGHLQRWDYAMAAVTDRKGQGYGVHPFARNRTNQPLAAGIGYERLVLLPAIPLPSEDTLLLALRLFAGIDVAPVAEPEWAARLAAPGQAEIDRQIADVERQLAALRTQRSELATEREKARSVLKVLYERGSALERIVRELLAALGGTVTDPVEANKEDGWIQFGSDEGVLEIKSTAGSSFAEDGLRQLAEWILRGESASNSYKGIFIGLHNAGQPPGSGASPFSSSFVRSATRFGIVAVLTTDLYLAYELMKAGKLTPAEFWPTLFQTNGIYDAAWLREK
ncbi:MAG: hypothetical protein WBC51_04990 [Vicinamibacterales bacterium]